MKTYHLYNSETLSAETKLREAERQGERGSRGEAVFGLRTEDRHQRRNNARKIQKMKEKVRCPARCTKHDLEVWFMYVHSLVEAKMHTYVHIYTETLGYKINIPRSTHRNTHTHSQTLRP